MSSLLSQWIPLALASGACAAFNGVFAKLYVLASPISQEKGLINVLLVFPYQMWALFTKSLSRAPSTTRVSIINTSANFMLTALLGWIIFSESLPPLWWLGAALLVGGNVIIGKRGEGEEDGVKDGRSGSGHRPRDSASSGRDGHRQEEEETLLRPEEDEDEESLELLEGERIHDGVEDEVKKGVDVDDPLK
ncbi:MAG: hypothetical protein M1837_007455 [Sclerophora amabilis]|nr:MAG: hypothetical protein M1837_007455 [Sclerophora amabilis]